MRLAGGHLSVKRISNKILEPLGAYNAAADCSEVTCKSLKVDNRSMKDIADDFCALAGGVAAGKDIADWLKNNAKPRSPATLVWVSCGAYGVFSRFVF